MEDNKKIIKLLEKKEEIDDEVKRLHDLVIGAVKQDDIEMRMLKKEYDRVKKHLTTVKEKIEKERKKAEIKAQKPEEKKAQREAKKAQKAETKRARKEAIRAQKQAKKEAKIARIKAKQVMALGEGTRTAKPATPTTNTVKKVEDKPLEDKKVESKKPEDKPKAQISETKEKQDGQEHDTTPKQDVVVVNKQEPNLKDRVKFRGIDVKAPQKPIEPKPILPTETLR